MFNGLVAQPEKKKSPIRPAFSLPYLLMCRAVESLQHKHTNVEAIQNNE